MRTRDLKSLGIPPGPCLKAAVDIVRRVAPREAEAKALREKLRVLVADPAAFREDELLGPLAHALEEAAAARALFCPRQEDAPCRIWGIHEPEALRQIDNACKLPISVRAALMPDAHVGYGLPIGGVLATRDAVIPYAVGVDIACRMRMTVLDLPPALLDEDDTPLCRALQEETRFGIGASFKRRRAHEVLDADWSVTPLTRSHKDKAWAQLGTSGSGNHFVELGVFEPGDDGVDALGLERGRYLALLSHSGSRGTGASVADHYSRLAQSLHPELPTELRHLAWLELGSEAGAEYWAAMELMGRYAAANHACIHRHILGALGARPLLALENHHNFAWKEEHDGEKLIVHRKGATPAGAGVVGIIPGSMASTTYVARGLGCAEALDSASHGAGRRMSRTKAFETLAWRDVEPCLAARRVKLLSAGLDEAPMVYKDIEEVMAAQRDLVEPIATFQPRLVKMAPAGERPEDGSPPRPRDRERHKITMCSKQIMFKF